MEILDAQSRENLEADGAWLYGEVVANRAFGVDYPAPAPTFTGADIGCYLDSPGAFTSEKRFRPPPPCTAGPPPIRALSEA